MRQEPLSIGYSDSSTAKEMKAIAAKLLDIPIEEQEGKGIAQLFNRWMKTIYGKRKK